MKTNYLNKWWAVLLLMLTMGVAQVSAQTTAYSLTENTTLNGENIINTGIDQWASWAGAASKLQSSNKCSEISEYINLNVRGVNIKLTNLKSFQIRGYSGNAERSFDYYINGEKVGSTAPGNTSCFLSDEYEVNSAEQVVLQIMSIGGSVYLGQVILTAMPSCTTATAAFATPEPAAQDLKGTFTNTLTSDNGSTIVYSSSDNDVATVDVEGKVTPVKAGSVTITATQVADATYCAVEESYELTFFDSDDKTPPTVDSQSITDGATDVALDKPITITFSEPITAANVTINSVPSTEFSIAGNILTITETLANCENYAISVSGATDAAGNVSTEEINFSFRTAEAEAKSTTVTLAWRTNAPACVGGNPSVVNKGDANISVTADGNVDGHDTTLVLGRSDAGSNTTATFAIAAGSEYTSITSICLRAGLQDASGNVKYSFSGGYGSTDYTVITTTSKDDTNYPLSNIPAGTTSVTLVREGALSGNENGVWIRNVQIGLTSAQLSVIKGNEDQSVEQNMEIEEIVFKAADGNATLSIEWGENGKPEGIIVGGEGSEILSITGKIAGAVKAKGYPYTVKLNDCTSISGTITVTPFAEVSALEWFKIKWTEAVITQPTASESIGEVLFSELPLLAGQESCTETYFGLTNPTDYTLLLDGTPIVYNKINGVDGWNYADCSWLCYDGGLTNYQGAGLMEVKDGTGNTIAEYRLVINNATVGTGSNDLNADAKDKEVKDCFNVLGVQVDCESNGIVIKRFTDGSSEKMLK